MIAVTSSNAIRILSDPHAINFKMRVQPDPNTTDRLEQTQHGERLLPPWSLRDTCIWRVRNELLASSCEGYNQDSPNLDNPFLTYPIQLRQEVLDSMMKLKPDGREVLQAVKLLIESGILRFDLSDLDECDTSHVYEVIELLIANGHCLQELNVSGQWLFDYDSQDVLSKLLTSVPNVYKLVLQEATESGQELEIALNSCPKLVHLQILQPSIDDAYLYQICNRLTPITNIKTITVPSTVKGPGLVKLLQTFPSLQSLDCVHLEDMLDMLESQKADKSSTSGLLSVRSCLPLGQEGVTKLVSWCPNLIRLSIEVQEFTKLSPVSKLTNLKSLELRNSSTVPASYIQSVLPLLENSGSKLTHLGLEHFDVVDLMKTNLSCPKLTSLNLRWFTLLGTSTTNRIKGQKPFEGLKSLILRPRTNRYINLETCELLLTHAKQLENLELYCCHGLVDNSVKTLVKTNSLTSLRSLVLRHGHGLSENGIKDLIRKASKLTYWDFGLVNPTKAST